ncbi:MAG: hypothetical protein MZV65_48050 [Chromatiales bacterium]|nr:hypothetical protein [Chromatiales bacterium]
MPAKHSASSPAPTSPSSISNDAARGRGTRPQRQSGGRGRRHGPGRRPALAGSGEGPARGGRRNRHRFPAGVRHFMGEPPNPENCRRVLRDGYQRQRIAAALYLALLRPGTPLFPTSAPAWRQKRWLAQTSA